MRAEDTAETITVRDVSVSGGNIKMIQGSAQALSNDIKFIVLIYNALESRWYQEVYQNYG